MTTDVSEFVTLIPATEVEFKIDDTQANVAQQLVSNFKIQNTSQTRNIVYKIKTTAPRNYVVKPNQGIIGAQGEAVVEITFVPSQVSGVHADSPLWLSTAKQSLRQQIPRVSSLHWPLGRRDPYATKVLRYALEVRHQGLQVKGCNG